MATRYVEGFDGANIERIGVHGLIKENEASDEIDGDKMFRFLKGYDSLTRALRAEAESYGATIHLDCIVRQIRWSGDQVEVTCEDAETFSALQAIITLPLGVLQASPNETAAVRFIPELPERKRAAIHDLAMGNALKINLHFRERFWESVKVWNADAQRVSFADAGFFHCPAAPFPTWWTQLPIRAPLLVGWTGGPNVARVSGRPTVREGSSAVGRSQSAEGIERSILDQSINSLARIFNLAPGDIRNQLKTFYIHDWHNDPFTRGAYAYVPVNGLESQRILSEPINNKLFFAGEATSVGQIGTVHGAIQSGQRAAKEILSI
jgi:monoamine oxidase